MSTISSRDAAFHRVTGYTQDITTALTELEKMAEDLEEEDLKSITFDLYGIFKRVENIQRQFVEKGPA